MKVEIVNVKLDKLREVKKQLRKGYNKNVNLKKLLTTQEKEELENNSLYKSIIALLQDETYDETKLSSYCENLLLDQPSDLYDILNLLESKPEEISSEKLTSNFMEAITTGAPGSQTCETTQSTDPINQNLEKCSINNLSCNEGFKCTDVKRQLYERFESGDIAWPDNSVFDTNGTFDIGYLEHHNMVDLEQFYAPNELLNLVGNEDFPESQNIINGKENSWSETSETHRKIHKEVTLDISSNFGNAEDILNTLLNKSTLVNPSKEMTPFEVNSSGLNSMVIAMEKVHKKKINAIKLHEYEEIKLLKGYNSEQRLNIIKAAKILYTKRTRTLLHWLDPELPVTKMKYTLDTSWTNLPIWQKEVYINQVLGPILKETVSPMLNPQLATEEFKPPEAIYTKIVFPKRKRMSQ